MLLGRDKGRTRIALGAVAALVLAMVSCSTDESESGAPNERGVFAGPDGKPAQYHEPVKLTSADGVLEVRLSAHQGQVDLDTVTQPVDDFLVFSYELIEGTSSDGATSADNVYPAPTLHVDPGERLIVHLDNDLQNLTVGDFMNPAYVPVGGEVPLTPKPLEAAPLNLHVHGLHVSPTGNSDNVLLSIPAGMGNVYDFAVPDDMPNGMYWYHSHRHTVTAPQTYMGLAGMLEIGRPDGNLPLVTENDIPIRTMALQYNFVFDRKGSGHKLGNVSWPKWVNTLTGPEGSQLADGTYRPSLAPVNLAETSEGAQYMTNWYTGPLSPANHRGQNQFIPSNLQSFTSDSVNVPANPDLPDNERDVQYTINGQFQPELKVKPGQTEIWTLANMTDLAYLRVQLTETATGKHPPFAIVGQDGIPFTQVQRPVEGDGTALLIPSGTRFAIAVTMPATGDLVVELPPVPGAKPIVNPGVLYTNNGTPNSPALLGTVSVDPAHLSYADGFFAFPIQTLLRITPDDGQGTTTAFEPGQDLDTYTSYVDTSVMTPDMTRDFKLSGGFGNDKASKSDPKSFTYEMDGNTFPNIPLIQPRVNSVEEWKFTNYNNDAHPFHVHVNNFQVTEIVDPIDSTRTGVQPWGQDIVNVPAPLVDEQKNVLAEASATIRTQFAEYTGAFVLHCHRLNHEDNGMMAMINVIPEVSSYAVAVPGSNGRPATVRVHDGTGDEVLAAVVPFPDFEGSASVAMADISGDGILDLVAGTGAGVAPEVVVYSGADGGLGPFSDKLAEFVPFADDFRGGVSVAGADIDGNALADNIIVATGPGTESEVKVFASKLAEPGSAPEVFSTFSPYPGSESGVTLATGLVDSMSGRPSIVTAPGPGEPAQIKTFRYDLYKPTERSAGSGDEPSHGDEHSHGDGPAMVAEFLAADPAYTGGVSLATGWVAGAEGGAQSVVTGELGGAGTVRVWSTGSRLDGQPEMYLENPNHDSGHMEFAEIASFAPFSGGAGVLVGTTSTTVGADLLVSSGAEVRKYSLNRPDPTAKTVVPTLLTTLPPLPEGSASAPLGGR
ncbi:multicopper oxidase domain-containing protein [Antrihabitans sp. YC2-6]|uniref:multicopper oxidase domain-containing protein n=1 Tax=Antrihabitans sp. YC2-6 TaxID=2799498 RepID=UPI0018F288FF|nr:multicopper oxidase domain-containing protein [Antrihabitans sp. YC2-6]MBJ8344638.1 multicopper oxidase domain-containing protein [Antrihabitans sp. YC2-6]